MKNKMFFLYICFQIISLFSIYAIEVGNVNRTGKGFKNYWANGGNGAKINGFDIYAKANLGIGQDDNVYLAPENEEKDTFYNLKAYLDLERKLNPNNKLYLSYESDFYRYNKLKSENSDNQEILGGFDFVSMNLYGNIQDSYISTSNINGILFTNRVERTIHEPSLLLGYNLNSLSLETKIQDEIKRYDSILYSFNDHDKKSIIGRILMDIFEKNKLYLEYNYSKLEYKLSGRRSGNYNQAGIGVKGNITPKLTGNIFGGYQNREYDDNSQSFKNAIFDIDITMNFLKNRSLNLNYLRTANESIILGETYYEINRIVLDFKTKIYYNYSIVVGGFYEKNDFPLPTRFGTRKDDVKKVYLNAGYEFKQRYSMQVEWDYMRRDSNFENRDYKDNMYLLSFIIKL